MRFLRITTLRDTFVPGPDFSKEVSSRLNDFAAPEYELERIGDAVHITARGETNVVPWSSVVGAMVDPSWVRDVVSASHAPSAFPGAPRISAKGRR